MPGGFDAGLGEVGWWDAASPDVIGGDGSDDDLQLIVAQATQDVKNALESYASNNGMLVLANMVGEAAQEQLEGILNGDEPDVEELFNAIADVHSPGTARSCMTEAIESVGGIIYQCYEVIHAHEEAEGAANIFA
jgi:hypothetical protein